MSSMLAKEKQQKLQEKYQAILSTLLREEDNKYCADCDSKGPRWASWNLGIFICIRCAGIHRNLGVHISRVKSVNLDQWTAEQIASMQAMGNSKARAIYECNLSDSFRRSQNDSAMEQFIRSKYEQRKWISKDWRPESVKTSALELLDDDSSKAKSNSSSSASNKIKIRPPSTSSTNSGQSTTSKTSNQTNTKKAATAAKEPVLLDFDFTTPQNTSSNQNEEPVDFFKTTESSNNSTSFFENINNANDNGSIDFFNQQQTTPQTQEASLSPSLITPNSSSADQFGLNDINFNSGSSNQVDANKSKIDKLSILALYNNSSSNSNNNLNEFLNSQPNSTSMPKNHSMPSFPIQQQQQPSNNTTMNQLNSLFANNAQAQHYPSNMPYMPQQQQQQLQPNQQQQYTMPTNNILFANSLQKIQNFNQQQQAAKNLNIQMDQLSLFDKSSQANKQPQQQQQFNNNLLLNTHQNNSMFPLNSSTTTSNASNNTFLFDNLMKPSPHQPIKSSTTSANTTDLFPNIGNTLSSDLWQ